ncbi:oligosaccharyl transferase subunit OST3/OST6 family [Panaeolus papilionaceus]|nr:oligosaccharyl transferase subunit OST3/OST6 family [Panaeolus papilionaceus]
MRSLFISSLFSIALSTFAFAVSPAEQLAQLAAAGNGIIKLDADTFDLLTSPKRTWSASVQLTALDPRRRCMPCKEFDPSFQAVAKAWSTVPQKARNEHFFATLDFDNGSSVFQKLGLSSAPIVYNYPAAEGPRKESRTTPAKYDFSDGFEPAPLAEFLSKYTPVTIPYSAPIDFSRWITMAAGGLGAIVFLRFLFPIVNNRWSWAAGVVITSLVMTSGYMFTRIRNVPFTGPNGNWVAAGYQNQFGQEVQVVAFTYGLLAFSFLMLTLVVPYQSSPQRQRIQVYLWTGVIMIVYSVLVSLFRVKNRGYPFKLFL